MRGVWPRMRILLVAYDFPPIPSPQALRWAYLVRELALAGNDVHVLAPDVNGYGAGQLPELPQSVTVHRCSPGPVTGFLVARQRRNRHGSPAADAPIAGPRITGKEEHGLGSVPPLNWKGRAFERINRVLSWLLYPDLRAEWQLPARKALTRLLREISPDVVISSHEPPVSIPLGLHASMNGFTWVADLGDPVLAPYTPRRWRGKATRLERALCMQADLVTVTSAATQETLQKRHGLTCERVMILTQGYDHRLEGAPEAPVPFDRDRLELVYTGSFYAFRRAELLLDAVSCTPGVRLTIATIKAPASLVEYASARPESIRLLGFVGHRDALMLQRNADVLVNLANADPVQVPGKVYEYLGASAPILHIGDNPDDAAAVMLHELGVGWSVKHEKEAITSRLRQLVSLKQERGVLIRPGGTAVAGESKYAWSSLAESLVAACGRLTAEVH